MVIGTRQCPIVPTKVYDIEGTVITNEVAINTAQRKVESYYDAFHKAAGIIAETISDFQVYDVRSTLSTPEII